MIPDLKTMFLERVYKNIMSGRALQHMMPVIDSSSAATVLSVRFDVGTIIQQ